jgi:hypothetical protein
MVDEVARLREKVAPLLDRILSLVDSRPKQPGLVPGAELPALYEARFGEALLAEAWTGQTDLKSMLNRRNIFPTLGVRGSEKKGGWMVYRVASSATPGADTSTGAANLHCVEENILTLLARAANPPPGSGKQHFALDAGKLSDAYGAHFKRRFNFRGKEPALSQRPPCVHPL